MRTIWRLITDRLASMPLARRRRCIVANLTVVFLPAWLVVGAFMVYCMHDNMKHISAILSEPKAAYYDISYDNAVKYPHVQIDARDNGTLRLILDDNSRIIIGGNFAAKEIIPPNAAPAAAEFKLHSWYRSEEHTSELQSLM